MTEEHDTLPPDLNKFSDRDLLFLLLDKIESVGKRLDEIDHRLEQGERRFREIEGALGLAINSVRNVCLELGLRRDADSLKEKRERMWPTNGDGGHRDEDTQPGEG